MTFDVFISYSTKDAIAAKAACAALEAAKIRCWMAPRDILPGARWGASIVRAINQCRVMVLIFSGNANASAQVHREVDQAFGKSKAVVPLRIEDVKPADELAYYLDTVHWLDALTPPLERNLEKLVTTVQALVPVAGLPELTSELVVEDAQAAQAQDEARTEDERRQREAEARLSVQQAEAASGAQEEVRQRAADEERRREELESKHRAEEEARPRTRLSAALIAALVIGLIVLMAIGARFALLPRPITVTSPSAEQERALTPKDRFQECSKCPMMMVVPAGSFTMGSPASEIGHDDDEGPQHKVTFAKQFAVGQYEVTFDEWDACVVDGGCNSYSPDDRGWGGGRLPVINVSWFDANAYVAWLAKKTGKAYRLLSEAEYEYATRAGTTTAYPWGDDIKLNGQAMANCPSGCGSKWGGKETAPVGSFAANVFGLYDMVGNVWEWTQDCWHGNYDGAPTDGSAWVGGDCTRRVVRGGSWSGFLAGVRSALRYEMAAGWRVDYLGFRVGRTLLTP